MDRTNLTVLFLGLGAALASSAMAHEGDIGLKIVSGKIATGEVVDNGSGEEVLVGTRVFGAEMGLIGPGFADEPGYFAQENEFAQGAAMGFNIRKALRAWNGSDFSGIAAQTLLIEDPAAINSVNTPATDLFTAGFDYLSVDASGGFDSHLNFTLSDVNAVGVYLLELESTGTGLTTSDAYWIVFNNGDSEEAHDAAIDWVQTNLVPAPGSAALLLGAGLLARSRRRGC